ncbi:nucleotidyltransferase family protein [Laspinema sp. D6]|nr:nucleotidyltransferase family protein [Laspinema sp. D3a]MCT7988062.1 nucleotidyltransferase family protein [Laspinema sp. D3a]
MIPLLTMNAINHNLELPFTQIQEFCQRWHITEFALFGSVLRDDFRPDSDIDVLVTFDPEFRRGLAETIQMRQELETLFGREVDFIIKPAIVKSENWLRRQQILESAKVIYATRSRIPD